MLDLKIIDHIKALIELFSNDKDYIARGFLLEEDIENANNLVANSTKLLQALLEGNHDAEDSKKIAFTLELPLLREKLV